MSEVYDHPQPIGPPSPEDVINDPDRAEKYTPAQLRAVGAAVFERVWLQEKDPGAFTTERNPLPPTRKEEKYDE